MRWRFRRKREIAVGTGDIVGVAALDALIPPAATVADRAAIGTARVAAYADRSSDAPSPVEDQFPNVSGVPEVQARDLSGACVASALHHHGSLVVRELLDGEAVTRVRAHLHPDTRRIFGLPASVEVDAMVSELARAYQASGLLRVVRDYLQEPPVAAANRIVVRQTSRGAAGLAWHQDGQFFGIVGALNVWTALDDCGLDRPSLNFVPRRVDHIIAPGNRSLKANPEIDAVVSELLADWPLAEPAVRAGDAMLFDEMTVHRTGTRAWSAPHRDLAITWFFAPSRFPERLMPLAL